MKWSHCKITYTGGGLKGKLRMGEREGSRAGESANRANDEHQKTGGFSIIKPRTRSASSGDLKRVRPLREKIHRAGGSGPRRAKNGYSETGKTSSMGGVGGLGGEEGGRRGGKGLALVPPSPSPNPFGMSHTTPDPLQNHNCRATKGGHWMTQTSYESTQHERKGGP